MSLDVVPVQLRFDKLSITCLDSWYARLLIGTEKQGIFVFEIVRKGNALTAELQNVFLQSSSIKQLNVADFWDLLLVLVDGQLKVYELTLDASLGLPEIRYCSVFPQTNIEKFSLCRETLRVCIYVHGKLYIYYHNGVDFCEVHQLDIPYSPLQMVLTHARLYVTHKISGTGSSISCSYFEYSENGETPVPHTLSTESITTIANYENGIVLLQQGCTSVILDRGTHSILEWFTSPKAVVVKEDYCVGITDFVAEAASRGSHGRLVRKVQSEDKDPLLYITGKTDIYVASSSSIWRIQLPLSEDHPLLDEPRPSMNLYNNRPSLITRDRKISYVSPSKKNNGGVVHNSLPYNFSPLDSLSVVGLNASGVEYMRKQGINNILQFAELDSDVVDSCYAVYEASYCKAVAFMRQFSQVDDEPQNYDFSDYAQKVDFTKIVSPEDPLEAIGLTKPQIEYLATMMVFTVRQFATFRQIYSDELDGLHGKQKIAVEALRYYEEKSEQKEEDSDVYGYVYLSTSEFGNCLDSRAIKSTYTLFQEYMSCDPNSRAEHPWKHIYNHYYEKAKSEMAIRGERYSPSDPDIFAYASSQFVATIGKFDATAASRAIFFYGKRQTHFHRSSQEAKHEVQINLTAICKDGGKLYYRTIMQDEWTAVPLNEYKHQLQYSGNHIKAACIVIPSGIIRWENIVANIEN